MRRDRAGVFGQGRTFKEEGSGVPEPAKGTVNPT